MMPLRSATIVGAALLLACLAGAAEAAALNFEVAPVSGEALEKLAAKVMSVPKHLAARAKPFLE